MAAATPEHCPKCSGIMEQGFVIDRDRGAGGDLVSQWAAGAPEKSFWSGTKQPAYTFPIGTYRCTKCGFLEQYARPEFSAS